jgi:RND family efflux transporter MFP subunit
MTLFGTRKKKWLLAPLGIVLLGGSFLAAKSRDKGPGKEDPPPFRLGKAESRTLEVGVREVGVVDPERKVDVKSAVSGRITELAVREGAEVASGALLARVEPDVTQAQSLSDVRNAVAEADIRLRDAERELKAQQALFDAGLIGREQLRDYETKKGLAGKGLEAAKDRLRIVKEHGIPVDGGAVQGATVTSPMKGIVIRRGVELGETVTSGVSSFSAGTVLFTVADLDSLIVKVNLNEVDIAKVRVGQKVRITLDAYPQKVFAGKVRFVAPAAKLVERIKIFETEIALDSPDEAFRTGMSANVEILGERREKALSIPIEALARIEGKPSVYRLRKGLASSLLDVAKKGLGGREKYTWLAEHWKDYFEAVPVEAGLATLERVEIVAGLAPGDQVALEDPTKKRIEKDDENN